MRFRNIKSETNRVSSSDGWTLTILGSRLSGSLIAVIELFLPGVGGGGTAAAGPGAALVACRGDCAVAGDGLGRATKEGEGGSSTRCRFRGPESSLRACRPSCGLVLVVAVAVVVGGRSALPPFDGVAFVAAVLLSSLLSIDRRSILCCVGNH